MLWLYYRDESIKRNINKENINMSKYKIGDKVRLRDNLEIEKNMVKYFFLVL